MLSLCKALFVLLVIGFITAAASADVVLHANLTHDQETTTGVLVNSSTGGLRPLSFGTATFILNDAMTALSFEATIFNIDVTGLQTINDLNDNLTNAHIHAPAPPGTNAGVVWGFHGMPFNNTMPNDSVVTPFAMGVGGTFSGVWNLPEGNGGTTLALQLPNIFAGLAYINFHTVQFPGGEIRGQIVPEPHSLAALALGAMLVLGRYRHRRRAVI